MRAIMERSNEQSGGTLVTGALVSVDQYFVEVLESSANKISYLLKQIMNNPAHENLVVRNVCSIERRRFREFPREGCYVIKSTSKFLQDFIVNEKFNPYELETNSIREFALEIPRHYKYLAPGEAPAQELVRT